MQESRRGRCCLPSLRSVRSLVAAVAIAALVATGCGGSSDDGDTATSTTEPAPTLAPTATVAPEPTATTPPPTATPIPTATPTPAEVVPVALNHIQVLGSHNSYHLLPEPAIFATLEALAPDLAETREYAHAPLTEQLEVHGIRQFELDVYADPEGGLYAMPAGNPVVGLPPLDDPAMAEPGYKVLHAQDYDYSTTCLTLVACLTEVGEWSTANPGHLPVMIMIEFKSETVPESAADEGIELPIELDWTEPFDPTPELLAALDAEVRSVFGPDQLIEPDDVRGEAATLEVAVLDNGWPALDDVRGQVLIALIGGGVRELYVADSPSLEGRPMFTDGTPGQPDAAFVKIDDPADPGIEDAVRAGYLVRTRTDSPTADARADDTTRRDTALAGGAHFLSTDYYRPSEFFDSPYVVELPGGVIARCNPIAAPPSCSADQLTE